MRIAEEEVNNFLLNTIADPCYPLISSDDLYGQPEDMMIDKFDKLLFRSQNPE